QLMKAMASNCGVENKSDSGNNTSAVSAKSEAELIKKFGVCMESELNTGLSWEDKYENAKFKPLIVSLISGDASAHKAMSGGRWFNQHSEAFQDYFGLNARDARQAFCTGKSAEDSLAVLRRPP